VLEQQWVRKWEMRDFLRIAGFLCRLKEISPNKRLWWSAKIHGVKSVHCEA
jgi:hypothetical protein